MTETAATLDRVWSGLTEALSDPASPMRTPVLATTGARGPEARMVVLRGADRVAATLTFHTDAATAKVADLAADPRATVLFWDQGPRLQVRMRARIVARSGTVAEWSALGASAQRAYGGTPPPGTPIDAPADHDPAPDPARFVILTATIDEIETLILGPPHIRTLYARASDFAGQALAP